MGGDGYQRDSDSWALAVSLDFILQDSSFTQKTSFHCHSKPARCQYICRFKWGEGGQENVRNIPQSTKYKSQIQIISSTSLSPNRVVRVTTGKLSFQDFVKPFYGPKLYVMSNVFRIASTSVFLKHSLVFQSIPSSLKKLKSSSFTHKVEEICCESVTPSFFAFITESILGTWGILYENL